MEDNIDHSSACQDVQSCSRCGMVADLLEDRHTFNFLWKNVGVTRAREQEHVSVFGVREQVHISMINVKVNVYKDLHIEEKKNLVNQLRSVGDCLMCQHWVNMS